MWKNLSCCHMCHPWPGSPEWYKMSKAWGAQTSKHPFFFFFFYSLCISSCLSIRALSSLADLHGWWSMNGKKKSTSSPKLLSVMVFYDNNGKLTKTCVCVCAVCVHVCIPAYVSKGSHVCVGALEGSLMCMCTHKYVYVCIWHWMSQLNPGLTNMMLLITQLTPGIPEFCLPSSGIPVKTPCVPSIYMRNSTLALTFVSQNL